jgi:hypothetical protein
MAHVVYDNLKKKLLDESFDTSTLYALLVQETNPTIITSAGLVSATMSEEYSGTSGTPLTETSGVGYQAGGQLLSAVSMFDTGSIVGLSANNVTWPDPAITSATTSTITAGGALVYQLPSGTYTSDGIPLIYFDFSASRVSTLGNFTITWNEEGIIELTS